MMDYTAARTAMVDCQVRPSDVTLYPIIDAMLSVPRERFVPDALRPVAYSGDPLRLAPGREMVDARVLGKMLDALNVGPGDLVLDVGTGLGYSAAVLACLAEAVIALEEDAELAGAAAATLADEGYHNVLVETGPLAAGAAAHAPFDAIILQGGAEDIPAELAGQLKEDGRIAAIITSPSGAGQCRIGVKAQGRLHWRGVFDASAPVLPGFHSPQKFEF